MHLPKTRPTGTRSEIDVFRPRTANLLAETVIILDRRHCLREKQRDRRREREMKKKEGKEGVATSER
ncbi:hypothetical protein KFK09_002315 [Dendrobium nobile]|uniref:Uncharacterized protein n=1 Tax=Dendrobium nobile TaxID=94219 RepID=A0A8T3C9Y9_DENNO|nr:hypothetical protein KFK09_002315 [Dendrobium nobile]